MALITHCKEMTCNVHLVVFRITPIMVGGTLRNELQSPQLQINDAIQTLKCTSLFYDNFRLDVDFSAWPDCTETEETPECSFEPET